MSAAAYKRVFIKLVELTENPLAPIIFQKAYGGVTQVGPVLAKLSNREKVDLYTTTLLSHWDDERLNEIAQTPEFVCALAGLLASSLEAYANKLMRESHG